MVHPLFYDGSRCCSYLQTIRPNGLFLFLLKILYHVYIDSYTTAVELLSIMTFLFLNNCSDMEINEIKMITKKMLLKLSLEFRMRFGNFVK